MNTYAKRLSSTFSSYLSTTEEQNIERYINDDNAFYCPRNPFIGNLIVHNFYANHAEGGSVKAIGKYTHAEGRGTIADVRYAHAEGSFTFAGGMDSHAEGKFTTAHGWASHAEGYQTSAEGTYSHAAGFKAGAFANNQWVWSNGTEYGRALSSKSGTFCINPTGGLSGFYIGNKSIAQHITDTGASTIKNDLKQSLSACFEGKTDPEDIDVISVIKSLSAVYQKIR